MVRKEVTCILEAAMRVGSVANRLNNIRLVNYKNYQEHLKNEEDELNFLMGEMRKLLLGHQ